MVHLPSVNRASEQPCATPLRATATISSRVMNERQPGEGGSANVQYPQELRHSRVSGRNTCSVCSCPLAVCVTLFM
jgi:hypothetical protein